MDLMGSADPYVNIQLGTQKFKVGKSPQVDCKDKKGLTGQYLGVNTSYIH